MFGFGDYLAIKQIIYIMKEIDNVKDKKLNRRD